ncbi:Alpha/beta hydrolase fold [Marinobacterium lacunae]|uniref:Alpha/beta hydrolase fold n=1 Tax=Marinobacterium lacunae TaxID=1232683 RepID=A0A081G011_9GAMM|nr:alpha/beta hydrolase [Marinobacterium lacunae]KEA64116.1 Alpha/beta hydrolase fold [Marinobacterium lacunae]
MFDNAFRSVDIVTSGATIHCMHGGEGPPLLLLHGYPQTHMIWHEVAPALAKDFHVICPDLRGYGDSSKPPGEADHANYSKRAMAQDMVEVMSHFGYEQFAVAGHDRGARVAHRMALDHSQRVSALCVMDIAPTLHMFDHTDQAFATGYYHWFFLIQPGGLPEHMIGLDPDYYLGEKLKRWSAPGAEFSPRAVAEYCRCFGSADAIHASCEDYRAAAMIDLEHDRADRPRKLECPVLVLWGNKGFVHRTYDLLEVWREYAQEVRGGALNCGHFLPEEAPDEVIDALNGFLSGKPKA